MAIVGGGRTRAKETRKKPKLDDRSMLPFTRGTKCVRVGCTKAGEAADQSQSLVAVAGAFTVAVALQWPLKITQAGMVRWGTHRMLVLVRILCTLTVGE